MTAQEHLLCCLAEECAEVAHRVSKALRFGLSDVQPCQSFSNQERLENELIDLLAVISLLDEQRAIKLPFAVGHSHKSAIHAKQNKVFAYIEYARKVGHLITSELP